MKSIRSLTLCSLLLALLASCLGAASANAQEVKGTFTLPFDARWGKAILPAGPYSFTIDQAKSGGPLILSGEKVHAIVRNQGFGTKPMDRSALILRSENGVYTVRELRLTDIGMVLYYAPHHPKHQTAAQEREMASLVPVTRGTGR